MDRMFRAYCPMHAVFHQPELHDGDMPKWILFHPYFVEWDPEVLVFNQQERGKNSEGAPVLFDNIDNQKYDYKYYYGDKDPGTEVTIQGTAYPLYYRRYVAQ